jgi:hypothetical protein
MAEKTKEEELKQKLLDFFDKKLTDLTTKIETDIDTIEKMKFDYFDSVIKKFEEIEEEHKKEEEQEKEKHDKEKHDKEKHDKEKPEKKEEGKAEKINKKKIDPTSRPKTPAAATTKNKGKLKEEKPHDTTDTHKDKEKKEAKPKAAGGKAAASAKTPAAKKDTGKRPMTSKGDPKAKAGKKGTANAKKGDAKKGKKDPKKDKKEESKKEEEPAVEEKKPVVINPKYKYTLSDDIKNNPNLCCLYFILKGKYITDKKQILHITTHSPLLYKSFGSNMKFLLDDKKKEAQSKAAEIEKFLNNYGDLNNYLTKEFSLIKKAINSIQMFKKKEEEEISKMATIPKEVGMAIKCIYYIIDEPFDEGLNDKELFENLINNIISKTEEKTFKSLLMNYFNHNKYLNLTKEKYDKINNIINENNTCLNMVTMAKICRPMSLFCFMFKEVHDYINLKTLDGQFYFDLRIKNDELQKIKDLLYLIEHDGKPREPPKEEKKEEAPKEEAPKTEEPPKTEGVTDQPKTDEGAKTEDQPKTEETTEQPKTEETTTEQPKTEETTTEQPKTEEVPPSTEGGEAKA